MCLMIILVIGVSKYQLHLERGRFLLSWEPRSRETAANERLDGQGTAADNRHERGSPPARGCGLVPAGPPRSITAITGMFFLESQAVRGSWCIQGVSQILCFWSLRTVFSLAPCPSHPLEKGDSVASKGDIPSHHPHLAL